MVTTFTHAVFYTVVPGRSRGSCQIKYVALELPRVKQVLGICFAEVEEAMYWFEFIGRASVMGLDVPLYYLDAYSFQQKARALAKLRRAKARG